MAAPTTDEIIIELMAFGDPYQRGAQAEPAVLTGAANACRAHRARRSVRHR